MSPFAPPSTVRPADRWLARGALLLLLAIYTATFTGLPENADAEVEYQTASSMMRRARMDLGGTPEAEALLAAKPPGREGQGFDVAEGGPGREGRYYSWFGVGQAFAALPFWCAGHALTLVFPQYEERHAATTHFGVPRSEFFEHLAVGWRNSLLTALTAYLIVLSARRVGATGRNSLVAGLSYGIATFAWPQARSTLSDVQATFCLFFGLHLLLLGRERWARFGRPPLVPLAGAGLALGWAFLTRVAVAPAVAFLGVLAVGFVLLSALRARRALRGSPLAPLLALGIPFAFCLLVFVVTNYLRFGDPLETGYGAAFTGGSFFSSPPLEGLAGVMLSPGKGLLWMAPGVLVLPFGMLRAWQRGTRTLLLLVFGISACILTPVCFMQGWHAAWTYGPRYLLPLLPFVWMLVALGLDYVQEWPMRRAFARALLWAGLLTSVPAVLVDYTTHLGLAQQAARLAWPDVAGDNDFQRDDDRFLRIQWDWRFAAPWAHWRILRHRGAGLGDEFPVETIFFVDQPAVLSPRTERERGLRHFAWVDFQERLRGPVWPATLLCLGLFVAGLAAIGRGLDDPAV
ncbi:MAG: hypothetical protein AAF682_13845 [Planctomycetota bacterium]